ncbi:DUF4158 domain-containing protein [Streptomyces tendae]|uniref:DUF4158 domain-containing protein n=1 Tax=Streptomyces tendae TaxID=1932 RepID=UPI00369320DD
MCGPGVTEGGPERDQRRARAGARAGLRAGDGPAGRRPGRHKPGFAVQLATVRCTGGFFDDPLDGVPPELVEYLAEQLDIDDPSTRCPGPMATCCRWTVSPSP